MVLGLIWFLSHLWVVEVILASSFRKREKEKLWHFLPRWRLLKLRMLPVNWERSRSRLFSKDRSHSIALRWKVSDPFFPSSFSPSLFLSSSYSRSSSLPLIFDGFSFLLLQIFFLCFLLLRIHEEEEKLSASLYQWKTLVPLVAPLSRHCGFSYERLEGFSLFKVQMSSFCVFSSFVLIRHLLVERQWVLGSETSSP